MTTMPSVNIIIPTYNQAAFIGRTIESAVNQDYINLTVIVSDDCSSDHTEEVVAPYVDAYENKLIYKRNSKNLGRVANYRKSLYEYATADWIVNLDGDDYYTDMSFISYAIERIIQTGIENVIFYQGSKLLIRGDIVNARTFNIPANEKSMTARDYLLSFGKFRFFSHMSTVYKRELAVTSGFYELDVLSSDIYSFLKLCINNQGKHVIISKRISGCWVRDGESASGSRTITDSLKNSQIYFRLFWYLGFKKRQFILASAWLSGLLARYAYWNSLKRSHKGYSIR